MSETKLPSEVMQSLMDVTYDAETIAEKTSYTFGMLKGATIAANHYEKENKRLVELLKDKMLNEYCALDYQEKCEQTHLDYWLQYCRDNNIKE